MENLIVSNKSYRVYIGHGNWINLSAATSQALISIFERGQPTRYTLAPGLAIDIIPHDVDCNSKNIDMLGLMRADLVYEAKEESKVHQSMASYVRSLLDEQGIIDAFPPLQPRERLPNVTSLTPHRHLSLVPSTAGWARRGAGPDESASQTISKASLRKKCSVRPPKTVDPPPQTVHLLPAAAAFLDLTSPRVEPARPSELQLELSPLDAFHPFLTTYELTKDRYPPSLIGDASPFHGRTSTALDWPVKGEAPWLDYPRETEPPPFELSRASLDPSYYFDPTKSTLPSPTHL